MLYQGKHEPSWNQIEGRDREGVINQYQMRTQKGAKKRHILKLLVLGTDMPAYSDTVGTGLKCLYWQTALYCFS